MQSTFGYRLAGMRKECQLRTNETPSRHLCCSFSDDLSFIKNRAFVLLQYRLPAAGRGRLHNEFFSLLFSNIFPFSKPPSVIHLNSFFFPHIPRQWSTVAQLNRWDDDSCVGSTASEK